MINYDLSKKMKFTHVIDIVGDTVKSFNGEKTYVSTGAVDVDKINFDKTDVISYNCRPSRANLVAKKGDVLFAKMAETKKSLLINEVTAKNIYSTGFFAVRAKKEIILPKCLFYLVNSSLFLNLKNKNCSGATQRSITVKGLVKIEIKIPPIDIQQDIIDKLDSLSNVINLKKEQLYLLEELGKSLFIEMFGTLDEPSRIFDKYYLNDLCIKITDGKHGGCIFERGTDRYFVGAREIYDDKIHYDTAPEISVQDYEKNYIRCNVEIGDFLIVNTGATIGKSAIAKDIRTKHTLLQKSVALLKVKKELLNPVFLKWCYKINEKMYKVDSASAQPNLLLSQIKKTEIYLPEISYQQQFVDFIDEIENMKYIVQKSLDDTQQLFDSLMQDYFGS